MRIIIILWVCLLVATMAGLAWSERNNYRYDNYFSIIFIVLVATAVVGFFVAINYIVGVI